MTVRGVKEGYDMTRSLSAKERAEMPTAHLRFFNNWVKSCLFAKYVPRPYASCLDLASGKGGDISKWKLYKPSFITFADISSVSIENCFKRFYKTLMSECNSLFLEGDVFSNSIKSILEIQYHIASCQFAIHYSFKSFEMAYTAMGNLANQLHEGGRVIITTINAPRLVMKFREQAKIGKTEEERRTIQNSICRIKSNFDVNRIPPFGAEYIFELLESVENIPEYLVHPSILIELANAHGLELVEYAPFQEFYNSISQRPSEERDLFIRLLRKSELRISSAAMTQDEWDVIGLYSFFVFIKPGSLPEVLGKPVQKRKSNVLKYFQIPQKSACEKIINMTQEESFGRRRWAPLRR